jgi:hypothetical protein
MGKDQENQTESGNQESTSTENGTQENDSQAQNSEGIDVSTDSKGGNDGEAKSDSTSTEGNPQRVHEGEGTEQKAPGTSPTTGPGVAEDNPGKEGTPESPNKIEPSVDVPGSGESQQSEPSQANRTGFRFQPSYRRKG